MTNPAKTIRKLAKRATTPEVAALIEQFAAEMEAWENRMNNKFQAALGLTELHVTERIDALEQRLLDHLRKVGDDDAASR